MGNKKIYLKLLTKYKQHCTAQGSVERCVFQMVAPDDYFRIWYHAEQWVALCNACQQKPKQLAGLEKIYRLKPNPKPLKKVKI